MRRYMNEPDLYQWGQEHGDEDGEDLPPFYEYGLSLGVVEAGTFEGQRCAYGRYQLSWGGPSDELRFFANGDIEYWFMDWFDGAHRDVTAEDWAQWLNDDFQELIEDWPTR